MNQKIITIIIFSVAALVSIAVAVFRLPALSLAAGALLVGGLAVILWGGVAFERKDSKKTDEKIGEPESKMAYIGTVAAGLAHEIRNPLNAIDFNIRMIQEDLEDDEDLDMDDIGERFRSTYKEIKHLERLVSDFLLYARKTVLQIAKTDLKHLIESVANLLHDQAAKADVKIITKFSADKMEIDADSEVLRQSLLNIAKNGIEAMAEKGELTIGLEYSVTKDIVVIKISDTGKGISGRDLRKIFHLFYTTRRNGTGLGLPVAVSIIENHAGRIEVDTKAGVGTTFVITLPVKQAILKETTDI